MKARLVHTLETLNPGKAGKLARTQASYREYVQSCVDHMVANKRFLIPLRELQSFFPRSPVLSSQLEKCARNHASDIVHSWVSVLYSRFKAKIYESGHTDDEMMQLRCVGKYRLTKAGKFGKGTISQWAIDLYWSWVWDPAIAGNTPVVRPDLPMRLSADCITFKAAKKAFHAGWWAKITCLDNGRRVCVPLTSNPQIGDLAALATTVTVGYRDGRWTLWFVDKTEDPALTPGTNFVGLDVGLNVLAATSDGILYGSQFKPKFDRLYRKVQRTRANRQRQGLRGNSPRLARLEQRITGAIKTATGTVANELVVRFPNTTFAIEDLDLKGCKGQKRFAYKALQRALAQKAPTKTVQAAYSSQRCPSCGYVNNNNRSGVAFQCRCCGRKSHSDVIGAINLLGRSEDKQLNGVKGYRDVGTILQTRFRLSRTSVARRKKRKLREEPSCAHTDVPDVYCVA